jgi:ferredoxin
VDTSFVTLPDGSRIAYDVCGNGPAVLLLHGGGGSRREWHDAGYVARLQDEFTVITMDLRGHGESAAPTAPADYAIGRLLEDILAVADACGILRGITDWGVAESVACANYYAVIDPAFCADCGNCLERCQVKAITSQDGVSVVERGRCIGCGLCVTGCPNDAASLVRKPEAEIVHPPKDFAEWEHQRLHNRGLAG